MSPSTRIARAGFLLSLASYALCWALEYWRPGFVINFFPFHLLLILAVGFGIWWTLADL